MCFHSSVFTIALVVALLPEISQGQGSTHKLRVEKVRTLAVMYGEWLLSSRMIPLQRPQVVESGTMTCTPILDSTYIECEVSLTNGVGRSRGYRQYISYNPDSSRFEVLYLYTRTVMRVIQTVVDYICSPHQSFFAL